MKQSGVVVTIACVVAAVPLAAAAADDPLAQTRAGLAKLRADAATARTAVAADASTGDTARLTRDAKAGLVTLKADWKLLLVDAVAARKAAADGRELRSLLQSARLQVKGFRSAVRSAFAQAKVTAKRNRGSNGSSHDASGRGSGG
jgi:hypothetical protein